MSHRSGPDHSTCLPPLSLLDQQVLSLPVEQAPPSSTAAGLVAALQLNAEGFAAELRDLQEHELRRVAAEQQAELARLRDVARFD